MTVSNSKWHDLPRRLLTISIGAPTVFYLIYLGTPFYDFIVLSVSVLSALEIAHMIDPNDRFWRLTLPLLMILIVLPLAYGQLVVPFLACGIVFGAWFLRSRHKTANVKGGSNAIYFLISLLSVGIPLALLLPARATPSGLWWTFALFVNNWTTDGFALIGGRFFGKTKLAPKISQAKTVEGAAIGLVTGSLAGFIVLLIALPSMSPIIAIGANLSISTLTIIGDLIESRIKRYFQVKDTGSFLPGHGGFLDRIDGLVISIPFWYLFVMLSQNVV